MSMTFTARFQCADCKTVVTFTNERPPWEEDPSVTAAVKAAHAWVKEHPTVAGLFASRPSYVMVDIFQNDKTWVREPDNRHIECPACDASINPEDGIDPLTPVELEVLVAG